MNPLQGVANVFDAINGFVTDATIDVMYKALAVVGILFALYFIPATQKFTVWVAVTLLFLLMIQSSANPDTNAPADSTLPLPTQIGTAVPQQSGPTQTASTGSSGGSEVGSIIGTLATIASFFV